MTTGLIQQKTQPFNIEAEISVLGSMLLDNEAINLVTELLRTDNFYKTSHQYIFDTIINLYNKNNAVDLVILKDELRKQSLLEKVGGAEYLMELEESVPASLKCRILRKDCSRKDNKKRFDYCNCEDSAGGI